MTVERPFKHTIVCFKNTDQKICTSRWYDNRSSDPQAERLRVVKAAAEVIREDIRTFDTMFTMAQDVEDSSSSPDGDMTSQCVDPDTDEPQPGTSMRAKLIHFFDFEYYSIS